MLSALLSSILMEWVNAAVESPYLYMVIGSVFFIILVYTLWLLFFKPQPKEKTVQCLDIVNCNYHNDADYSPVISDLITSSGMKSKCILFAGAGLESMPVTVSVKSSVQLAQSGRKCLLIDLDTRRNAAAKVFEIKTSTINSFSKPKPVPTMISNLFLWPADYFIHFKTIPLKAVIESANGAFDAILINAPCLDGHPDRKLIASSSEYGLIFYKNASQFQRLQTLLENAKCKLLIRKAVQI